MNSSRATLSPRHDVLTLISLSCVTSSSKMALDRRARQPSCCTTLEHALLDASVRVNADWLDGSNWGRFNEAANHGVEVCRRSQETETMKQVHKCQNL